MDIHHICLMWLSINIKLLINENTTFFKSVDKKIIKINNLFDEMVWRRNRIDKNQIRWYEKAAKWCGPTKLLIFNLLTYLLGENSFILVSLTTDMAFWGRITRFFPLGDFYFSHRVGFVKQIYRMQNLIDYGLSGNTIHSTVTPISLS